MVKGLSSKRFSLGSTHIVMDYIPFYIHPYMDGNGRTARFVMNVQLISGGYSWVVVPVDRRVEYMQTLEKASVEGDITGFLRFILTLL